MKFTLSWLKTHLATDADLPTILKGLTNIGLEVEGVENPADKLAPFRIARVLTAEPHPQADKLQVLTVDAGDGPLQVVCGAPNARAGLVGVFGTEGAVVPVNGMVLKKTAIRGVESNGMMCSFRELELGEDHEGIIELNADSPVGEVYARWAGLDDPVIDVSITPNRQDCMGVRGIARDLAAAGLGTLNPIIVPTVEGVRPGPDVRVEDEDGCPAFFARTVQGVTNGQSPEWMARRLKAIGQKPISTLVDITNYLMIDLGRPLHVYDMATLKGPLTARKGKSGEEVLALNGKTYTVDETMTVIADNEAVHDIGGIMGGEHSGATDATTDVLIECAYFTPERIAVTGQKLGLTSDARGRFERGVDPAFLDDGLSIATDLVVKLCGGTASEATRAGQPPIADKVIRYEPTRCLTLAGVYVGDDEQKCILESLGFSVDMHDATYDYEDGVPVTTPAYWDVSVPSWRRDVDGWPDLVEEVVRIVGLDQVASTPLPRMPGVAKPTATAEQLVERRVRRTAAARGLAEAINWSFISEKEAASVGGGDWMLANPISEDLKVMRPSLLPGLLSAARRNIDRAAASVRLFELGRRYFAGKERATAGFLLAGEKTARSWQSGKAQAFSALDAKAEVIALLAAAGAPVANLQSFGEASAAYHPGQSGTLRLGPKVILAEFGVVHPSIAKQFGMSGIVVAGEIFLDNVPPKRKSGFMRSPYAPPALQAVKRDFAFVVDEAVEADALVRAVKGADKKAIVDARLFDVFVGPGVDDGRKSLAIEVTLQPGEKSFSQEELDAISAAVVKAAEKLGGVLRG
ncbi:phenylalanine--tRNA ligase subunit beta [Sphingomonadales bacterium 56]|uniref:phenylalanine--tRNA ligase subunit beta n=1 Tax=unclassified Sphingobium TaxID=2611147 RepID=UPI00191B7408|nr:MULTISPECIES: phenylalanine--tRNA ligase subunit beta [unclassified Sphingobium]MBY2929605.1 phenylalanine--tRNA ligase subunit beta [Sphingomonadales bacterium 56]MBY2958553.1 phenylalanine--tRNA ligase subunit beta [Sphingomonadales bacterium 58]CAD7337310.1 Phenylalanine--tRNA ligase beta subunit [Sphingobium sp. S8]CAD7339700.1 Phenylalanine--tRNA ligase beta subunit [Sphingobium sp. S6]